MFNKLREQTGQFLVTIIISLIIIGFMFTGYQSFQASPDTVAQVGDIKVNYREYRQVLNRQMEFFSYQFGGKPLSSKQIEQFRLKPRALESIVNQKLMIKLADELGAVASKEEIVSKIKEMPVFQTDKQFDVNKYKGLLQANRLTPNDFEKSVAQNVKLDKIQGIMSASPISKNFIESIRKLNEKERLYNAVIVQNDKLQKSIEVSPKEIKEYLQNEQNSKRVNSYFESKKDQKYNKKEQVKASHILIVSKEGEDSLNKIAKIKKELNTKNFAKLANKYSEDPGNKSKKGGSLGWFSKGRMVPEFEKVAFSQKQGTISEPVKTNYGHHIIYVTDKKAAVAAKIENHQDEIAREFIQQDSKEKLAQLKKDLTKKIESALLANNKKQLNRLKSKFSLTIINSEKINLYEGTKKLKDLTQEQVNQIYNLAPNKVAQFSGPFKLTFVTALKKVDNKKTDEKKLTNDLKTLFSKKINENSVKIVRKIYPPKSYPSRL